jgi:hypothetical protein
VFHVETFRQKNPVELSTGTLTAGEMEGTVKITGCNTSLFTVPRLGSQSRAAKKATSAKVAFFVSTAALFYIVFPPEL